MGCIFGDSKKDYGKTLKTFWEDFQKDCAKTLKNILGRVSQGLRSTSRRIEEIFPEGSWEELKKSGKVVSEKTT